MRGVTGIESLMAKRIKTIIKTNPAAPSKKSRDPNTNIPLPRISAYRISGTFA
jgi:hypothetical protein